MTRIPYRFLAAAAVAVLAACIPSVQEPGPHRASPSAQTDAATRQCLADLERARVRFQLLPDRQFTGGCSALGSVQLLDVGVPVTNLGAMTCPLARRFAEWLRDSVQVEARNWLGAEIVRIESFGTYSCRPVNSQTGGRLSEHGRANAVDLATFVLDDGRRITVAQGWQSEDAHVRGFLRAIHRAGCRRFNVGLGPDANAFHRDHFHFDMGAGPYCR